MSVIRNLLFLSSILFVISSVICTSPSPEEVNEKEKEASDSPEGESDEKDLGTVSPELEKLEEEIIDKEAKIIEKEEENAEKFGIPLTSSPEKVETSKEEVKENAEEELQEVIETGLTDKSLTHITSLFEKIASKGKDEEIVEKSPAEMKEMKEEVFKLNNELNEKHGYPKASHEKFDKFWDQKKEEYGKQFPHIVENSLVSLKTEEEEEPTTPVKLVSESVTEVSTQSSEMPSEETPKDAFIVRSAKGKICILAKFHSVITITYSAKSSEQNVEVTIPSSGSAKGKCGGPNRSPSMQISWWKFVFALMFNKTSEDAWGVTSVELTYDTSEPLFDGAVDRGKVTAKSKKVSLFETPFGKSYFCPAQEVILLYSENQHVATVRLKEVHLQAYDVEDGKFSPSHRCNQVVIGGPDEEPFVQDETIPLAVGCTLALITLLILVGFSVHRAYNAAKVDYNTME